VGLELSMEIGIIYNTKIVSFGHGKGNSLAGYGNYDAEMSTFNEQLSV